MLRLCSEKTQGGSLPAPPSTHCHLLLGLPGQRGVVLLQRGRGEVGGGQLPVHGVPDSRVSVSCSQGPQRFQVVIDGLCGEETSTRATLRDIPVTGR